MTDPIITAVAATFRQIALWGLRFDAGPAHDELMEIARKVEALSVEDDICCPVCEEVTCDDDCPLAPIRGR